MKLSRIIFFSLIFSLFLSLIISCNQQRQVVPFELDLDEVYKAVPPNEDSSPENLTFGDQNTSGFIFNYEIQTPDSNVYILFENLTLLDVNPIINQNIFNLIEDQLVEFGFINDTTSLNKTEFLNLVSSRLSYDEAGAKLIDNIKTQFEKRLENSDTIIGAYNIYFQFYPVYLDSNYVTFRETTYCYTGGAHGINYTYLKTYDLKDGHILTLDEVVKPNEIKEVREEVAAHFAYSYPIYENITTVNQYIDSLNVWLHQFNTEDDEIPISLQNFPLTNPAILTQGLGFVYQMYELTPGSDGCPVVVLPYSDIKGCLFDSFGK